VVRTAHKARQPLRPSFQPARCTRQLDDGAPDEFSPRRAEGAAVQPRRRSSGQPDAHTCSRKAGTPAFKTPALKRRPLERQLCLMTCSHEGTLLNASLRNACPQTSPLRTPAFKTPALKRHISERQLCLMTCSHEGTFLNTSVPRACSQKGTLQNASIPKCAVKHQPSKRLLPGGLPRERLPAAGLE
jgi:hypothetical protein